MKTNFFLSRVILPILSMSLLFSCQKEDAPQDQNQDQPQPQEAEISISIQGEFDEFIPDTKSQAQTVSRIYWSGGEQVYAYVVVPTFFDDGEDGYTINVPTCVGTLTATVEDGSDGRIAILSGTISKVPSDGKLFLLHSPLLSSAPSTTGSVLSVSLATQGGTGVYFVSMQLWISTAKK